MMQFISRPGDLTTSKSSKKAKGKRDEAGETASGEDDIKSKIKKRKAPAGVGKARKPVVKEAEAEDEKDNLSGAVTRFRVFMLSFY